MSQLEFRAAVPEDCEKFARLFAKLWSWEYPAAYWHHKFFENPAGEHMGHVAVDTKTAEIVGSVACIPLRYRLKGNDVIGSLITDVGVLPEYRKYRKTYWGVSKPTEADHYERKIAFVQATGSQSAETVALHTMHFNPLCPVPIYTRPITMRALLPGRIRRFLRPCCVAGWWATLQAARHFRMAAKICETRDYSLAKVREPDERFDRLWSRIQERWSWPVTLIRDRQFLAWRFARHPVRHYQLWTATRDDTLMGYCVTDILRRDGIARGRIVDLLIDHDHPTVATALLHQAAGRLISEGADMLVGWFLPAGYWSTLLREIGMRSRLPRGRHIIVRPLMAEDARAELMNPDCWYYTGADTDQL